MEPYGGDSLSDHEASVYGILAGFWPESIDAERVAAALEGTEGVYVAIDVDGLDEDEVAVFMPEPDGIPVARAEELLRGVAARSPVLGAGVTGLRPALANVEPVTRLLVALGL